MADLTLHTAWTCQTSEEWEAQVQSNRKGHSGSFYTVRWERLYGPRRTTEFGYTCTCTGFKMRGTCAHVASFYAQDVLGTPDENPGQARRCAWDSEHNSGGQLEPARSGVGGDMQCPHCQRPARPYRFGA